MNIYQVTNENDIMELLNGKYKNNITVILFINGKNVNNGDLKKFLKRILVKKYPDILILYVNIESYDIDNSTILENVDNQHYPYVSIYWNSCEIGDIKNTDDISICEAIEGAKKGIEKYMSEQKKKPIINIASFDINNSATNGPYIYGNNNVDAHMKPSNTNPNICDNDELNCDVDDGYIGDEEEQNMLRNIEKMEKLDNLRKIHAIKEIDRIIELQQKTSK